MNGGGRTCGQGSEEDKKRLAVPVVWKNARKGKLVFVLH